MQKLFNFLHHFKSNYLPQNYYWLKDRSLEAYGLTTLKRRADSRAWEVALGRVIFLLRVFIYKMEIIKMITSSSWGVEIDLKNIHSFISGTDKFKDDPHVAELWVMAGLFQELTSAFFINLTVIL